MTTEQNKLALFIHVRKKIAALIFVVEGDQQKIFGRKILLSMVITTQVLDSMLGRYVCVPVTRFFP